MAKITKNDDAPNESIHFAFGSVEFDLNTPKASFKTDDPVVIAGASAHPWLAVEQDAPAPADTATPVDPLDPHQNPTVDHLSQWASQDAIDAAASNEKAIRSAAGLDDARPAGAAAADNPTVAETEEATLKVVAASAQVDLPSEPAPGPEATQPGGGVAPDEAPTPDPAPAPSNGNDKAGS